MPATSLASADRTRPAEAASFLRRALGHRSLRRALLGEAARVFLRRLLRPLILSFRQSWAYRLSLRGPVPEHILFHPLDPRTRRLEEADALMRGRFRLGGERVEVRDGSIFDCAPPSEDFALALHGFEWLRHLGLAGGNVARNLAIELTQQWLARHGRFTPFAWRPEVIAERLVNLFAHGRFFLGNSDLAWRARLFVALRDQTCVLARTMDEAPEGSPRLKAAAALALAGLCLGDAQNTSTGLKRLAAEIERQILPDGGHASRSPAALLEAFLLLAMVQQALDHANRGMHPGLRGALDRMAPMLRFFRHGDGALAVFHGGGEADARTVERALEYDETGGKPLQHAPNSGFQRLAAGRTLVLMDVGPPPPALFSARAHAGCLAFEMSAGKQRLIVNCGMAAGGGEELCRALRSTAAHSTVTIGDASSAEVLADGLLSRLLGSLLVEGPGEVETRRGEGAQGTTVDASHDGYVRRFGVLHQRRMTLSPRGLALHGLDRLIPRAAGRLPPRGVSFAARFHIHPDVRLSLSQGGHSVILKLPQGEGWRFRCSGGVLSVEDSIYFGAGAPRRTEQLVVRGEIRDKTVECGWLFEQVGSA